MIAARTPFLRGLVRSSLSLVFLLYKMQSHLRETYLYLQYVEQALNGIRLRFIALKMYAIDSNEKSVRRKKFKRHIWTLMKMYVFSCCCFAEVISRYRETKKITYSEDFKGRTRTHALRLCSRLVRAIAHYSHERRSTLLISRSCRKELAILRLAFFSAPFSHSLSYPLPLSYFCTSF